ncbi:hypothetical protein BJY04DRAFT_230204 [Aspergillus karnatakaensis]|uniref:putative FAD-binding monooxygenase n=1 Tax=Aspergillus karnatakaensis TaxID=1810916 RepID=UPI003CCD3F6A
MKILICGAGIAGTALTLLLSNLNKDSKHQLKITLLERAPSLRDTGLQVDLRGPGIQVLRRMGLEEAFQKVAVQEQGLRMVDSNWKSWGYFPANKSGKGLQSFTSEFEIMRGDFCRMLYAGCLGGDEVEVRFGVWVTQVKQRENGDRGVEVVFSDGKTEEFDLVVGADGLGSRMRRMMMMGYGVDDDVNPGYHSLGAYAAYGTVAQKMKEGENYDAVGFMATRNRGVMVRRHRPDVYQAYVFCRTDAAVELNSSSSVRSDSLEEEKRALVQVFKGTGWNVERTVQGLVEADDYYRERIGVIKLDRWHQGRAVLVGDAAYCPSAMTGMGTTCGIVGAYILAGEIAKHCSGDPGVVSDEAITAALQEYEKKLRPFMDQVQKGLTDSDNYMDKFPSSSLGIALVYYLFWISSLLRLDVLARWVLREDTKGWALPDYPELDRGMADS